MKASGTRKNARRADSYVAGRITLDHLDHFKSRAPLAQSLQGLFKGRHALL
jgi:hypothetical protein